jgi:predicted MFS family arabinose efflux permease
VTTTAIKPSATGRQASWAGVVSLSLGIFAIVMSEFLPASLLPRIADDLRVSDGAAGQAVSVTAFAAALSALLISVVLPRADRRRVKIGLLALIVQAAALPSVTPAGGSGTPLLVGGITAIAGALVLTTSRGSGRSRRRAR